MVYYFCRFIPKWCTSSAFRSSVLFEGDKAEVVIDGLATNINRQSFQVDLPNGIILDGLEFKTIQIESTEDNGLKSLNDSIHLELPNSDV